VKFQEFPRNFRRNCEKFLWGVSLVEIVILKIYKDLAKCFQHILVNISPQTFDSNVVKRSENEI
jgi:hypothetical protein